MTVNDATREARETMGDDAATRVKAFEPAVNATLYAPADPDDEAAAAAWDAEASLRAFLRENSTARQRVLAAVDPRPLIQIGNRSGGELSVSAPTSR
jgi:hypothetical protein